MQTTVLILTFFLFAFNRITLALGLSPLEGDDKKNWFSKVYCEATNLLVDRIVPIYEHDTRFPIVKLH